jgi:hypothetical protein
MDYRETTMLKPILLAALSLLPLVTCSATAAELTATEKRWLRASSPVLAYSQRIKMPVDIIVQPQARPGDVPLAMGFDGGRCKLVLSLRGNAEAESVLENVPEADRTLLIEAMAAHEIGHCWRYVRGVWHALPSGFEETGEERAEDARLLAESKAMRENRREEGFADLVALAWTQRFHPEQYARVYAWMDKLRSVQLVARSGHDTRAWVRLARDASVFDQGETPFDAVMTTWGQGLLNDE